MPPMTNNEFDNVLLVFSRIGKSVCTYINICINKLKIFNYTWSDLYIY